jgi:pentatricopeptide repeat protein
MYDRPLWVAHVFLYHVSEPLMLWQHQCISFVCAVTFNALLEVCVRTNDLDRGMDVIDRMVAERVEPDEQTLEIVQPRRSLRAYLKKAAASASGVDG